VCGAEQRRGLSTKLRVPTFVFAITLTFWQERQTKGHHYNNDTNLPSFL
jgi:hypothetical protein